MAVVLNGFATFLSAGRPRQAAKAFHFPARNTRNAVKHAHFQDV
jgi:hypothetical protein